MADTPETAAPGAEPSMEEILASIRKIIADDPEQPAAAANGDSANDVIELTQMVQDDGSVVDVKPQPAPEPPPPPPKLEEPPPAMPETPKEPVVAAPPPPPPAAALASEMAVGEAATALSSLASTVEIERLASEPRTATFIGNGGRTLEDMAIELMRPLLKQWLDQNLPGVVERLVQKEVDRISKKVKD